MGRRKRRTPKALGEGKRQKAATESVLSDDEIYQFERDGFVMLRQAFLPQTAIDCRSQLWHRLEKDGIIEKDPNTWVKRQGIPEIYGENMGYPWNKVMTPRLVGAINQLCGETKWRSFGCGWWVISFPGQEEGPWGASGKWHVDGAHYRHHLNSKESGLLPIFLFSSIDTHGGGTALRTGSHRLAAKLLMQNEPRGLKGGDLSKELIKVAEDCPIHEVRGTEGDVMLTHPFLLHARSKNLGTAPRFMCNPNVELFRRMAFPNDRVKLEKHESSRANHYTPVERCIVQSVSLKEVRDGICTEAATKVSSVTDLGK